MHRHLLPLTYVTYALAGVTTFNINVYILKYSRPKEIGLEYLRGSAINNIMPFILTIRTSPNILHACSKII